MKNLMNVKGNIYVAGVYAMKDAEGVIRYIGSGINCNDRLSSHLYFLKRNLYAGTNKQILQEIYDRGELTFEVVKISESNNEVANMTSEQKKALQEALGVVEEFYIGLYDTVCNKMMKVTKWSTSPSEETTEKRRIANTGVNNPHCKYDETLISNILWLKERGFKPKEIVEMLLDHDIDVNKSYISSLGVTKWIYLESKKPTWYNFESEVM